VSKRDTSISAKAKKDSARILEKNTNEQHNRNRIIIREIVEHTQKLKEQVEEKFNIWREFDQ